MAFVSVSPWWTVSEPGGQTPLMAGTQMGWVSWCMPGSCTGCQAMWVSPGPSAVFRVSACLWTWTLTFRGVQVGSREWLGGDWIIVTMPSHQTPGSGGSWSQGNCVSVWTMTMLCQMTQGRVTAPDLSFYLNRYLISAMTRGKPESLILSTIYCYFKIF